MTNGIDHPIEEYEQYYRDEHQRNALAHFEALVADSGVDEKANAVSVAEFRSLKAEEDKWKSIRLRWKTIRFFTAALIAGSVILAVKNHKLAIWAVIFVILAIFFWIRKIAPSMKSLHANVENFENQRKAKEQECWAQVAPLNRLHRWGTARALTMKTLPLLVLDPHLTEGRLRDLASNFGLSTAYSGNESVLYTQGGSLKRNPFVVVRSLSHWMGTKTYMGSITIAWIERQRQNDQWVNVRKTQVLTATVTEPFPEYGTNTTLIYGHEAGPDLTFSRKPSRLSGGAGERSIERKANKVERKARKATKTGDGGLTVMANREFEALFHAIDRNDEVSFRVLFTPMAQEQMVGVLNDRQHGFGDDFTFLKRGKLNFVGPSHLQNFSFDDFPSKFQNLDVADARKTFLDFNAQYFRSIYFAFAPLFCIPIYQDEKSFPDATDASSFVSNWEHEAMAHYVGESNFAHPNSVTRNMLKTVSTRTQQGADAVSVTAHGYAGVPRVTVIPRRGNDGNWHNVPVSWTEYLPVQRTTSMIVGTQPNPFDTEENQPNSWAKASQAMAIDPSHAVVRGTLVAALVGRE